MRVMMLSDTQYTNRVLGLPTLPTISNDGRGKASGNARRGCGTGAGRGNSCGYGAGTGWGAVKAIF
jgi:hypothetical protein